MRGFTIGRKTKYNPKCNKGKWGFSKGEGGGGSDGKLLRGNIRSKKRFWPKHLDQIL